MTLLQNIYSETLPAPPRWKTWLCTPDVISWDTKWWADQN